MAVTLANFVPFAFAMLDTVALVVLVVFIARGLLLAVLGRRAWKTVLVATTAYVVWANALLGFGLTAFNPGAYVVLLTDFGWRAVTGARPPDAFPSALRLLVLSWTGVSLVPTLATLAIQRAAERRVW